MQSISLNAEIKNLDALMSFFRDFCHSINYPESETIRAEVALEEIIVNVINYAYPSDKPGLIKLNCSTNQQYSIIIEVIDQGRAYNPLEKETPDLNASLDDVQVGGLGIFLSKEIMDDIQYQRIDNNNSLTLFKK